MLTPSHRLKHSNASAHNANFSVRKSKTLDDLWKIGLPHLRVCEGRAQRATKPAVNALSHNNPPKRIRVLLRCCTTAIINTNPERVPPDVTMDGDLFFKLAHAS